MTASGTATARRIGGWGFEGVTFEPTPQLLGWLEERIGPPGNPAPSADTDGVTLPEPRPLPSLPAATSRDRVDRLAHARGQGLPDLLRLRHGSLPAAPDAVVRPADAEQVARVLESCARAGVVVIPWGGGTSVTGGVNPPRGDRPVVVLALDHLDRLVGLDGESGLAEVEAGMTGPQLESSLASHGVTLGHFPQSWELSTVGGWIATRSSGQESLGYGRIEDMVAGLEVVAPGGRLELPPLPASAAGPDLRQLVMGSEGRFGVITRAVLRISERPGITLVDAALLPSWEAGLAAVRELTRSRLPLGMLRLSDADETQVAMAVGLAAHRGGSVLRGLLRLKGLHRDACLLLTGASGEREPTLRLLRRARLFVRDHGGFVLGTGPGRHWLEDRFRHPYLRDALLDRGIATDTLETAAPWSRLGEITRAMKTALVEASEDGRVAVLCHVSHPYRDGASLYFTFFFPLAADPEESVAAWARLKRTATRILNRHGATVSHHHGVGRWHAPWLEPETGPLGLGLLRAVAARLDPSGILNPQVLLDPTDRLEE